MPRPGTTGADAARARYARAMGRACATSDPETAARIAAAFAAVPREDFLGPPPWQIVGAYRRHETDDPAELCDDVLVALDRDRGLNNGEPSLHARFMAAARPVPGEAVSHLGAGTGYYSAILAELVSPGGRVAAYEIEPGLAARAEANLAARANVVVLREDACTAALPASDLVYVSAGVTAPPVSWLEALTRRGRLLYPWQPSWEAAMALIVHARAASGGWPVTRLIPSWFVPCSGACKPQAEGPPPGRDRAAAVRSLWRRADRAPDATAIAVYSELWYSTGPAS